MPCSVISIPFLSSLFSSLRLVLPILHLLKHPVLVQPRHCTFILWCIFILLNCRIKFRIARLERKNFIYFKLITLFLYFNFLECYTRKLFFLLCMYFSPNNFFFFFISSNYCSQGMSLFQPILDALVCIKII